MTMFSSRARKAVSALAVAAVVGVALAPAGASAKDGHRHHGYGAAAFAGGLLLGAVAASSAYERDVVYERECWTEKRKRRDAFGDVYFTKIRVCD